MLPPSLPPPVSLDFVVLPPPPLSLSELPQATAPSPSRQAAASAAASRVPLLCILQPSFLQDLPRHHRYVQARVTDPQVRRARAGRVDAPDPEPIRPYARARR